MKQFILSIALLAIYTLGIEFPSFSQTVYLSENFESGVKPPGWTEIKVIGNENWRYRHGGYNPNDPNFLTPAWEYDPNRFPEYPHEGTYNALFYSGSLNTRTKLITPPMDLEYAIKPELTFWLCQMYWAFGNDWDAMRVYYRTSPTSAWVEIAVFEDAIDEWTEVKINLPNTSSTYQVAFEGQSRQGLGTCIDDVSIVERGVLPMYINEQTYTQPISTFVPSGVKNAPIMRMSYKVYGNVGTALLESINVTSLNTSDNDIATDGVKLFRTSSVNFTPTNQISYSTNFVDGQAIFENIDLELPTGLTYIWLAYDVSSSAQHGNLLDAMIEANSILANDTLYPSSTQSPPESRLIRKSIFFDNFENSTGWDLNGEFEIDSPTGLGGSSSTNPDPSFAYSGTKVLGSDLTGVNAPLYNYQPSIPVATPDLAISPTIDAFYYKDLYLSFQRYLNLFFRDTLAIEASVNNGVSWKTIWRNITPEASVSDFEWGRKEYALPVSIQRTSNLKFRFRVGPTIASSTNYSGWNIDDVAITGKYIAQDAAITEWVSPLSGCGHTSADAVTVKIANLGGEPINTSIPVAYSINGGVNWITESYDLPIAVGDTIEFTFATPVDFSQPGLLSNIKAKTILPNDDASENDILTTSIYKAPTYTPPFAELFETNDGYWRSFGQPLWEHGAPVKQTINSAASGAKVWATSTFNTYGNVIISNALSIFQDDFETDKGWTFTGEFERNNTDYPYYSYLGEYFIGNDISEQGANPNAYENGITYSTAHAAISPAIDVSNYASIELNYYSILRVMAGDTARLQISPDNGTTWVNVWDNNGQEILEFIYQPRIYQISDQYSNTNQFRVRFAITHSSAAGTTEAGWNVDNFTIKGRTVNSNPSYIESPCFNLTGITKPVFEAKMWVHTEVDVDGATLYYSIDNGDSWVHVSNSTPFNSYWNWYGGNPVSALSTDGWSGNSGEWITVKHLLPNEVINISSIKFRIAFAADKLNNNYDGIAIDDVKIYEAPHDFGITDIVSPASACDLSTSEAVTVTLKNFGVRAIPSGETVTIGIKSNRSGNIEQFTENITLTSQLAIGATVNVPLVEHLNMSISGVYNIEAFTDSEIDPLFYTSSANDTAFSVVEVMKPFVDLGPDIYTVHPDTITFDVTNPNATSYLWQDDSTEPIFNVTSNNTATYSVTLSNDIPCTAYDEVLVVKLNVDLAITEIVNPVSNCELSNETLLTVEVINLGTDTLLANRPVTLGYEFDEGTPVEVVHNLSETLYPDSIFNFTFNELFDMSQPRSYPIRVWVTTTDDETIANNEVSETVTVYGYPLFDLTPDSVYLQANSYVVDAGAGYNEYFWHNDESTSQTFTADSIGWVYATVSDINGCSTTDSIYVHLKYRDVVPFQIITPISSCGYETAVAPSFVIKNNGTDTLFFSTTIVTVSFQFEGNEWVEEETVLTQDIYPNDTFTHTFSQTVDVTVMGDYSMVFKATTDDEMRPENDELSHNVSVFTLPIVNLGDDIVTHDEFWVLDAGAGFEEYLWSTDETTQTITVTESGTYSVTVTNNEICSDTDEVQVTFIRHDYGILTIVNPVNGCSQAEFKTVLVRFSNLGNDTLQMGQTINFGYRLNENPIVNQDYVTTFKLFPGSNFLFTFSQQVNITEPGEYTLKAWAKNIADVNASNDSLVKIVNTHALPVVDLGPEHLWVTFPYELNSNVSDVTYLWNTGSTEPSIIAESVGKYWLRVINSNSCLASDTIYLHDETWVEEIPGTSTMISVYPNPSRNWVNAEISTTKQSEIILEVFSSTGQFIEKSIIPVTNSVVHTIDVSNYLSGIYLLRFTEGKKYTTIRLSVTR